MHDLLKRNYLSHSGREIVMNSIMTVMTYIIYEYEGCRHSKGPIFFRGRSLIHMGEGSFHLSLRKLISMMMSATLTLCPGPRRSPNEHAQAICPVGGQGCVFHTYQYSLSV